MKRIESVDLFRLIAILGVIAIHTEPFLSKERPASVVLTAGVIVNQVARFAVPFLFVISGFFWGTKIRNGAPIDATSRTMIFRVLSIFVFWSLIYLLPHNLGAMYEHGFMEGIKLRYWHIMTEMEHPFSFLFHGTNAHLWFLPALACAIIVNMVAIKQKQETLLLIFAVLLYCVALLGAGYADTPIGFHSAFSTRDGPFFSTLFFTSGYFLLNYPPSTRWVLTGLGLAIIGFLSQLAETSLLHQMYGTRLIQDFQIGTYFYGTGIALIALGAGA